MNVTLDVIVESLVMLTRSIGPKVPPGDVPVLLVDEAVPAADHDPLEPAGVRRFGLVGDDLVDDSGEFFFAGAGEPADGKVRVEVKLVEARVPIPFGVDPVAVAIPVVKGVSCLVVVLVNVRVIEIADIAGLVTAIVVAGGAVVLEVAEPDREVPALRPIVDGVAHVAPEAGLQSADEEGIGDVLSLDGVLEEILDLFRLVRTRILAIDEL